YHDIVKQLRPPTYTLSPYTTLFRSLYQRFQVQTASGNPPLFRQNTEQSRLLKRVHGGQYRRHHLHRYRLIWLVFEQTLRFLSLRSEEHTSELQSRENLVCRLLLENK